MLATDIETHARMVDYRPVVVYGPRTVTVAATGASTKAITLAGYCWKLMLVITPDLLRLT